MLNFFAGLVVFVLFLYLLHFLLSLIDRKFLRKDLKVQYLVTPIELNLEEYTQSFDDLPSARFFCSENEGFKISKIVSYTLPLRKFKKK